MTVDADRELTIEIEGPWLQTILYEIYILKIVNQLYFLWTHGFSEDDIAEGRSRLHQKVTYLKNLGVLWADFGTRRAYHGGWHYRVLREITEIYHPSGFVGTSNVMLADKFHCKPIGTMAHEIFQVCQALGRPQDSQKLAMQMWADEYRGDLGIALSDTLGIDKFLRDFDMYFAKLFDGVRHDSGDPLEFADKVIAHYEKMGIDPKTKTAVFSDGLTVSKVDQIERHVDGRMKTSYGIGTNLTNDLGPEPLQIVMKVVEANGQPVAKISDSPGKGMCEDPEYEAYLRKCIKE